MQHNDDLGFLKYSYFEDEDYPSSVMTCCNAVINLHALKKNTSSLLELASKAKPNIIHDAKSFSTLSLPPVLLQFPLSYLFRADVWPVKYRTFKVIIYFVRCQYGNFCLDD